MRVQDIALALFLTALSLATPLALQAALSPLARW